MKNIGDRIYAIIDNQIHELTIEKIDAACAINPNYYACNVHEGAWVRDSKAYDTVDELVEDFKSVVVR